MMSRGAVGTILVVLGSLLAGPAVAAFALEREITDQERYLAAVAPMADDPAVRAEIASRTTAAINERLGPGDAQLPESARRLVGSTVTNVVNSDSFRPAWIAVNRAAHPEVLAALRDEPGSLRIDDDTVRLDLGVLVADVRARMVADGVPFAERLPDVDASMPLFSRPSVRQAIPAYRTLEALHLVLPVVALALLAGGVVLAPRRTLLVAGVGVVLAMVVVAVFLWVNRSLVVARSQTPTVAGAFYDALTDYLTVLLWVVLGIAAVAALAGLVLRWFVRPRDSQTSARTSRFGPARA